MCETAEGVTLMMHKISLPQFPFSLVPPLAAIRVSISLWSLALQSLQFLLTRSLYWNYAPFPLNLTISSSFSCALLTLPFPLSHSTKKDLPTSLSSYTLKGIREYYLNKMSVYISDVSLKSHFGSNMKNGY